MAVMPQHSPAAAEDLRPGDPLAVARRHRAELLGAIQAFERALATPAADPSWRDLVTSRLWVLRDAFAEHVLVTEGDDGLYAELLDTAPRLTRGVAVLEREHTVITAALHALADLATDADAEQLRGWSSDLLRELSRHRQRGADLVYEAYATDIGGET